MLPESLQVDPLLRSHGVDLTNYCGFWCIEEAQFSQLLWQYEQTDFKSHFEAYKSAGFDPNTRAYHSTGESGSVAVVELSGAMTKKGSSMSEGGSTLRVRHAIRQAAKDPSVNGIILKVDSPGGTVSGTSDLAEEVAKANQAKPVVGFVEDMAASAALWVVSQCSEVWANSNTAQIGSIGTFFGLYDFSGKAAEEKVKAITLKTGKFKGGGFPGAEVSEEQIDRWQQMVDDIQVHFTKAVATGRGLSIDHVKSIATGETFIASDAKKHGLINGVCSFGSIVERLQDQPTKRKGVAVSEQVTFQELVSSCHGIDPSQSEDSMFLTDCLQKTMSTSEASKAWSETLVQRVETAREELESLKSENAELQQKLKSQKTEKRPGKGVDPVGTEVSQGNENPDSDPVAAWNQAINEKVKNHGMTKQRAAREVNREQPELRKALLAISN